VEIIGRKRRNLYGWHILVKRGICLYMSKFGTLQKQGREWG
jgi:hypothetical protein